MRVYRENTIPSSVYLTYLVSAYYVPGKGQTGICGKQPRQKKEHLNKTKQMYEH